jgi:hypothetical protein
MRRFNHSSTLAACCFAASLVAPDSGAHEFRGGSTLRVGNNGIDSGTCGDEAQPCRSISQAIANAAPNDTIRVGPGHYGDLNNDNDYDDPGEEQLVPNRFCIVCVDKRLRVISTHGAQTTVIQSALGHPVFISGVVALTASGAIFGERRKGFTIRHGASIGLFVVDVQDVRVAGNILVDNFDFGIEANGSGVIAGNFISGSNIGITASGSWRITDNVALANTVLGIGAGGTSATLINNASTNNGRGFTINAERAVVQGNVASGSAGNGADSTGFTLFSPNVTFVQNTVVGNQSFGVHFWTADPGPKPTFKHNNIFGNDVVTNCGFVNRSNLTVDATQNYWGAPTGPGPDPADDAGPGSGCDLTAATLVVPFAAQPFAKKNP